MDLLKVLVDERERLNSRLEELAKQKAGIDAETAQVNLDLNAIDAYEKVKADKQPAIRPRGKRTSGVRQTILDHVNANPNGLKRAELLKLLGGKGNKTVEQSVSNALTNLKKDHKLMSDNGVYKVLI